MQPGSKRFVQFLKGWLINTLAVLLAVQVVQGIHFPDPGLLAPVLTALMLGILNAFIPPILVIFSLPLLVFTPGLFMLLITAPMLSLPTFLIRPYFQWA